MTAQPKRLVQSPDKSRWYYLRNVNNSQSREDLTLEMEAIINSEVLSVLEEIEAEYEKDINSEWFSSSGGQVDLVSFAQSIKNRYKL